MKFKVGDIVYGVDNVDNNIGYKTVIVVHKLSCWCTPVSLDKPALWCRNRDIRHITTVECILLKLKTE